MRLWRFPGLLALKTRHLRGSSGDWVDSKMNDTPSAMGCLNAVLCATVLHRIITITVRLMKMHARISYCNERHGQGQAIGSISEDHGYL